jgi:HEAT repeat protein
MGGTGEPGRPGSAQRRAAAIAGHRPDETKLRDGLTSSVADVRATSLRGLARADVLSPDVLEAHRDDADPVVRRTVATLMADYPGLSLDGLLDDPDETVREVAAWACGEHERVPESVLLQLIEMAQRDNAQLVREAAVAALGAIGDERGLVAVLTGTKDKPAIRRRAVIALVPFDGPEVDAAWERALSDRDWQVRQLAEDLGPRPHETATDE